jgi:hypothetical protein
MIGAEVGEYSLDLKIDAGGRSYVEECYGKSKTRSATFDARQRDTRE